MKVRFHIRTTQRETRECFVFVFTETWLNNNISDSAIQLHGLTCYRANRDTALSGKTCSGGLYVYINKEWCNNAVSVKTLLVAGGVYNCEVLTLLSAEGVHGHCYHCCVYTPLCKRYGRALRTVQRYQRATNKTTLMAFHNIR